MKFLLLALLLILAPLRASADWHLLELDEASADYKHYLQPTFNAYFPEQEQDGLDVNVDSTVGRYFFWNSQVHGTSDQSQYRQIGLFMEVGLRLSRYVDLSVTHHSQHILDDQDAWGRHFPVENYVNVKVYFYSSERKRTLIP